MSKKKFIYVDTNGTENEVSAGGVLFYKSENDSVKFLMIKSRNKYEDFGGCIDKTDKDIYHTIAREVQEESNNIFSKKDILKRISNEKPVYSNISKYLLYIIPLTNKESSISPKKFGNKEIYDDIDRTVEYVSLKKFKDPDFLKNDLSVRMKSKDFFKRIFNLNEDKNKKISYGFDSDSNSDSDSE